jgi:hypothetical protein
MSQIGYGLATSIAYPSGEEGDNFLLNYFYLPSLRVEKGGGGVATL